MGDFSVKARGHGDGAEGRAGAHAGGPGGAHADGVGSHAAAHDAELGDELADLAAVLGRQRDVGGGQGGAGGEVEGVRAKSTRASRWAAREQSASSLPLRLAVGDELRRQVPRATLADAAAHRGAGRTAARGHQPAHIGELLAELPGFVLHGLHGPRASLHFCPSRF